MGSLHVSRRDFFGSALAASSLVAAGLPLRALAMGGRTPTNVVVSHGGASHSEPCLAVNPRDPRNLLAACQLPLTLATYASFDGGLTWRSNGPLPLPAGTLGGGNVSAGFDGAGRGFVCGLLVASGSSKAGQRSVYVWRTEDGGRRFDAPVAVTGDSALDRPWLATDPGRPGAIHVVWSDGASPGLTTAVRYTRSTDGARTFEAPRTIASKTDGLGNPMVACGPSGRVVVIYSAGSGALGTAPPDSPSTATVICSPDGGQTFSRPIALGHGPDYVAFPGLTFDLTGAAHSSRRPPSGASLPAVAADPSSGLVCAAFIVHQAGAGHAAVQLAGSRDGGRTWSPARAITPQDQVIYFSPQVAFDDAGRIGVMAFAMNQSKVSVVLMLSQPATLRFGPPITVTNQPFNPAKAADQQGRWSLGDYQALATTPGAFHPLWNGTRTGQLELFTTAVRQ